MNKYILAITLILNQINCEGAEIMKSSTITPNITIMDQINTEIEEKLSERFSLKKLDWNNRIVTWVGRPALEFQIVGPSPKEKLRMILIEATELFLNVINSNIELRPFLEKFPLSSEEIDIGICINKSKGKFYHPDIFSAALLRGKLYYHTLDKDNEYEYKTSDIENYSTALKIVKEQKN